MKRTLNRLERPDLMAKQIAKLYRQSSEAEQLEGASWYLQANQICKLISDKFHCPLSKTAGVVAALSPATNWQQNIADAHNLILAWHHGFNPDEVVCTTYGPNKVKAIRILNLESSNERDIEKILLHKSRINKTTCFYLNILHPENDELVTVDRHAIRIALGDAPGVDNICMTEKRYRNIAESYRIASKEMDLSAIQLQAVVWCAYRRLAHIAASGMENEIFQSIVNQI